LSQFTGVLSALVFVVGADAYRSRPRFRRGYAIALLPVLIWFTLAPVAFADGVATVFAPGHLLTGGALAMAGIAHLALLRQQRLLGALLSGCMMLVTASAHLWIAYRVAAPVTDEVAQFLLLITIVSILTALGMQLMTFEDMTYELRRANSRLETAQSNLRQLVVTDALTGCRNRRFFDEIITHELSSHRRYSTPLSLLFVDVDHFKTINDAQGHAAGDRVLREVAMFLMRNTRGADYVFRWGGDEFLLLLSCREDEAARRGADLRTDFDRSLVSTGLPVGVGLSYGCAEVSPASDSVQDALKLADERMYANKRAVQGRESRAV
jgi:diguanylate cyclase (GGDEF)-like protein